jgi:Carboxypeptidase regulatory-like domain/TonB dependent receptor
MKSFSRHIHLYLLMLALAMTQFLSAQTFRGGIAGAIQDSTGAVVPNAKISLIGTDTGYARETVSTSSGDYSFQDLPLGSYSIKVDAAGFSTTKIDKIVVTPGQIYSLDIKVSVVASSEQIEVNAAAVALDTVSSTNNAVVNDKAVANIPLNGRDYTQLVKIVPGYNGAGSLNGTRTNQNNWQIDGADNNDIWQNGSAANQGGVGSIAGVTIPIDAIDQFTVQSQGNAEVGRNGGGLISLAIKSGTNRIHGSAYYFNRNEFFAARSPFLLSTQRKTALRNQQFGGSIGGPIIKDKLFYFANYEEQKYLIQNTAAATEPTAAYVTAATNLLTAHGIPVNPLSTSVLALWPEANKPVGPASAGNYLDGRPQSGYSYNSIAKIDWTITPRQTLSARAFIGTGRQFAASGTNIFDYYQVAPDITQNFTAVHNWAITDHLSNQALAGVGVFNQTFNDQNHSFNMPALGLNTGVTSPSLYGAPTISVSGLDQVGVTQALGRKDYTGHLTDTATYVIGKHQFRFGGEFRRNYMDLQYQRNTRGTFSFSGSATANAAIAAILPAGATAYNTDSTYGGSDVRALADYLAGFVASSSFTQGVLRRGIYQKAFDIFAQDQYQILPTLTLNYGLRYTYNGPFSSDGVLSDFRPGTSRADAYGLVTPGNGIDSIYPKNGTNLAPRFGFSYQAAEKFVIRGTYGLYFDVPNFNGFFDNRPGNGGASGVQANPTGATPVENLSRNFYQWTTGVDPFVGASVPAAFGLATISPNFRTAYVQNFNLNTQYQVSRNTILQVGYVGSVGRRLFDLIDINQAAPGSGTTTATLQPGRPYYSNSAIPNAKIIAAINQIESEGTSNYNSAQVMLRTSNYHGLTAQGSYTYGHALDVVSGTRGFAPQNSANLGGEYGSADFDVKHTFNGYFVYEVPKFTERMKVLTNGWQGNAFVTAFTGVPLNVKLGSAVDNSHTGEFQDRPNLVGDPSAGLTRQIFTPTKAGAGKYVQWFNASAFAPAPVGTFGTMQRNSVRGPGFATVDASLVKNTLIHEGINLQLRAEMFNIFNHTNLANPSVSTLSSATFGQSTSTRNNGGAPGIGPGEPFNVQFAGKIIF